MMPDTPQRLVPLVYDIKYLFICHISVKMLEFKTLRLQEVLYAILEQRLCEELHTFCNGYWGRARGSWIWDTNRQDGRQFAGGK